MRILKSSLVIFVIVIFLLYLLASYQLKQEYKEAFAQCKRQPSPEIMTVEVQECISAGGCWETCGSACGLLKPRPSIEHIVNFYMNIFSPQGCILMCQQGCLYPV